MIADGFFETMVWYRICSFGGGGQSWRRILNMGQIGLPRCVFSCLPLFIWVYSEAALWDADAWFIFPYEHSMWFINRYINSTFQMGGHVHFYTMMGIWNIYRPNLSRFPHSRILNRPGYNLLADPMKTPRYVIPYVYSNRQKDTTANSK